MYKELIFDDLVYRECDLVNEFVCELFSK